MTICYFGIYDPAYARNRVLLAGLAANGVTVVECRVDPRIHKGVTKYWKLYQTYKKLAYHNFDFVLVAFPGHPVVWLAKLLFKGPIVFDVFVSLYDSNVYDRKLFGPLHPLAWKSWLEDYTSMHLADALLMDTRTHAEYCAEAFGVKRNKFIRVFVGSDTAVFYPRPMTPHAVYTAYFHGNFIPLHGVAYIVEAARLLRDQPIRFRILGRGQEYPSVVEQITHYGLSNVELLERVPLEALPEHIASADVCLGIFGNTPKASRVIPNKVYEYMAVGRPIITADTPAMHELQELGPVPITLVPPANPEALAEALKQHMRDADTATTTGQEMSAFFTRHFTPEKIVQDLFASLTPLLVP